jgi:hypothetical protein
MRHQERIYIQTAHSAIRNKDHHNVNMSSDLCEFLGPTYTMTGATIIMTGATVNDHNIHIIDSGTTFDLTFSFTGNVSTFITTDTSFNYDIYSYNYGTNVFSSPAIFESGDITWDTFSGTSAFTDTLLVSEFIVDGEYLVKGNYIYPSCTGFLGSLGDFNDTTLPLYGTEYGIYNPEFDDYFALIAKATKPVFTLSPDDSACLGTLLVESTTITDQTEITTSINWVGKPIVALNGLTLGEGEDLDYELIGENTVIFNAPIVAEDIVTIAFIGTGSANGLVSESFLIEDPIASGATNGEGVNTYYFNTGTTKYELFMLTEPVEFDDMIVTLNGVTLANVIDYTNSIDNPLKIILNGNIFDGDILTITYNSYGSFVGTIYVDNFNVFWVIIPAPPNDSGMFTISVAEDNTFASIIYSGTTPYITNQSTYSANVDLAGYTGTTASYKVTNQKDFTLISGDVITTTTDSDIIPITLSL